MGIVFTESDLHSFEVPFMVQEYINHDSTLFKVCLEKITNIYVFVYLYLFSLGVCNRRVYRCSATRFVEERGPNWCVIIIIIIIIIFFFFCY
jgi:hypothetical protein